MAHIAQSAVFVSCAAGATAEANAQLPHVRGPTGPFINTLADTLACYPNLGFQATHFGDACRIAHEMVTPQLPSKLFMVRDGAFVEIDEEGHLVGPASATDASTGRASLEGSVSESKRIYPTLFCGMTANLLGTGCREALRFLLQEGIEPRRPHGLGSSFLSASSSTTTATTTTTAAAAETATVEEKTHIQQLLEREIGGFEPALGGEVNVVVVVPPPLPAYKSFLSAIVTSGGGIEHDIRRACEAYDITQYSSEAAVVNNSAEGSTGKPASDADGGRFGNVEYGAASSSAPPSSTTTTTTTTTNSASATPSLFTLVMRQLARRLVQRQTAAFRLAQSLPIPDPYVDTCTWAITPSEVWCLAGLWLPSLIFEALCDLRGVEVNGGGGDFGGGGRGVSGSHNARRHGAPRATSEGIERIDALVRGEHEDVRQRIEVEARLRAESTVVYWAACQEVPIFSPSFVDGDVMGYILDEAQRLERERELSIVASASASSTTSNSRRGSFSEPPLPLALNMLKIDLVRDVYYINKMAMMSKFTGMLICGGGVVKHHICNANLMRNGADLSIFLNNGQEFDGSDGGARPEEAISWGKIRIDGQSVKVYSEVSAVFPLLVASVFVPAVRERQSRE